MHSEFDFSHVQCVIYKDASLAEPNPCYDWLPSMIGRWNRSGQRLDSEYGVGQASDEQSGHEQGDGDSQAER